MMGFFPCCKKFLLDGAINQSGNRGPTLPGSGSRPGQKFAKAGQYK